MSNRLDLLEKLEAEARRSVERYGVTTELHGINSWLAALAVVPAAPIVVITEDELIEIIQAAHSNEDEACCDCDYTDTRQRTLAAINDAVKTFRVVCPEYPVAMSGGTSNVS